MSKWLLLAARILLGLPFVVFGLNGFFGFIPQPAPPEAAASFLGALVSAGYLMPLVKAIEVLAGLALLSGRFVPLALVLLAPILINIVGFHWAFDPAGVVLGAILLALELVLAWFYRDAFRGLLAMRAQPRVANDAVATRPEQAPASA